MKKQALCALLSALLLLLLFLPIAAEGKAVHWYCVRNKEHRQPTLPPDLAVVEKYDGYYLDRAHGDENSDRVIYLTFDAGYENGNVAKILDILQTEQVPAAFFLLEHFVNQNHDLVCRMANEGHLVCNHTATHKNLAHATKQEIAAELSRLEEACRGAGVAVAPYFRPPEGTFSEQMLASVKALGYKTVFWSSAHADWDNNKQPSPQRAMKILTDNLHNGQVLLLHPTSATNVAILPELIAKLKSEGYRFGTLVELCSE